LQHLTPEPQPHRGVAKHVVACSTALDKTKAEIGFPHDNGVIQGHGKRLFGIVGYKGKGTNLRKVHVSEIS